MKYLTPILLFLCVMFVILICKTISSITYFFSFYIHILAVGVMLLYAIFLYAIDRVLYAILRPNYIYFWIIELLIIMGQRIFQVGNPLIYQAYCVPLLHENRTVTPCHPPGCAYRQF